MLKHIEIFETVIKQVQCQACCKSMSAKNLTYSHAGYCVKRVQEVDKPKAIPVPKNIIPKLHKTLPIKGIKQQPVQDEESDDDAAEFVQGHALISEEFEKHPMNNLKTSNYEGTRNI
jgi:hypothetical protein